MSGVCRKNRLRMCRHGFRDPSIIHLSSLLYLRQCLSHACWNLLRPKQHQDNGCKPGSESNHDKTHGENGTTFRPRMLARFVVSISSWFCRGFKFVVVQWFFFVAFLRECRLDLSSLFLQAIQPEYFAWVSESWYPLAPRNENDTSDSKIL